ncbi:hypothetical protein ACS0TY_003378 [Phlomoides rotata]
MFDTSGFEWDEARRVMTFRDDDIWDEYVKASFISTVLLFKSDPLDEGNENCINAETEATTDENEFSVPTDVGQTTSGKKKKSNKRHIDESTCDRMVEMMGKFCEQTNENFQAISKRIGYDVSLGEKREKLYEALGKLEVLTLDQ